MGEEAGETGAAVPLLSLGRGTWICFGLGALLWVTGLLLWAQEAGGSSLDHAALLFYDPLRHTHSALVGGARWLTSYGMPSITLVYVALLLLGIRFREFALPAGLYLLVIFSLGLSGIAGNLLQEVLARPRPMVTYAGEVLVVHTRNFVLTETVAVTASACYRPEPCTSS